MVVGPERALEGLDRLAEITVGAVVVAECVEHRGVRRSVGGDRDVGGSERPLANLDGGPRVALGDDAHVAQVRLELKL